MESFSLHKSRAEAHVKRENHLCITNTRARTQALVVCGHNVVQLREKREEKVLQWQHPKPEGRKDRDVLFNLFSHFGGLLIIFSSAR